MKPSSHISLRAKILLLIVLVFIFFSGLSIYKALQRFDQIKNENRKEFRTTSKLITSEEKRHLVMANLVAHLVVDRLGKGVIKNDCRHGIVGIPFIDPELGEFALADPDGKVSCNSIPWLTATNVADQDYFKQALKRIGSGYVTEVNNHDHKQYASVMAFAMRDKAGRVLKVILVKMDFSWVSEEIDMTRLPADAHLLVIDSKGKLVAGSANLAGLFDTVITNTAFYKQALAAKTAVFDGPGFNGKPSIIGVNKLSAGSGNMSVLVDIPYDTLLQPAYRDLIRSLQLSSVVLILVLSLAYYLIDRYFLRRLSVIEDAAIKLADGDITARAILPVMDELGQLAKTFNMMAESIQTNRAKDSFFATMSHEIRTPLTGMLGMLEVLSLTPLNREQNETLQAAWDSARSLLRIVNDILDWSKIEETGLTLTSISTSVQQILRDVVNTYSRVASAKSLVLSQHADEHLSEAHIVDGMRLAQVLNNFVSNAIKFTPHGEVELRAELIEQTKNGETIRFSVRDTGIGIPQDVQQHLFQRYRQGSDDTARLYGGTGLGLAICRRVVEAMDGKINLVSEPDRGSTFCFTLILPVSAAPGIAVPNLHPEVPQRAVKPLWDSDMNAPLVLAVDDHPINRNLLANQLRLLGLRAETAENGQLALSMWQDKRFALVITDCHMPVMDGYALARAIRTIEIEQRLSRTTIIAWTANAQPEETGNCQAADMDELLTKPTSMLQLKKTLAKWLNITETGARLSDQEDKNRTAAPINYAVLEKTVPDTAEHLGVLQSFLSHIRTDRDKLTKMLQQDDQVNVARTAHRMRGSSLMVGAIDLVAACGDFEQSVRDGDMSGAGKKMATLNMAIKQIEAHLEDEYP